MQRNKDNVRKQYADYIVKEYVNVINVVNSLLNLISYTLRTLEKK